MLKFLFSPIDEHLAWFQFEVIEDKAATNIHAQIFRWIYVLIFLAKYNGMEFLGHRINAYLHL